LLWKTLTKANIWSESLTHGTR